MPKKYSIKESEIMESIKRATEAGRKTYIIIDGNIYDIQPDTITNRR